MPPVFGFALYFVACLIVAIVASKRGRSGLVYFFGSLVGGFVLAILIGQIGGGMAAGFGAFLVPVAALITSLSSKTSEELAVETGSHGDFRKCPFCAESIRKEAIRCKHCGSDVPALGNAVSTASADDVATSKAVKQLAPDDMECQACKKHIPKTAVRCAYCGVVPTAPN